MAKTLISRLDDENIVRAAVDPETHEATGDVYDSVNDISYPFGGGGGDITVLLQTLEIPETEITGIEEDGFYYSKTEVGTGEPGVYPLDTITIDEQLYVYKLFPDVTGWTVNGVELYLDLDQDTGKIYVMGSSDSAYTVTLPATTVHFYRASEEVAETFKDHPVIDVGGE